MHLLLKKHKFLALTSLLLLLLVLNLASQSVRGTVTSLLSPLQSALWQGGQKSSDLLSGSSARELELETENLFLSQQILLFEETKKENDRLREALGAAPREGLDLLFAEIVGKEIEGDVLFLNKGSAEGVKEGMAVITQSRVAVGSIGEVFLHTSKLFLLSLKDHAFDVKIQGKETVGVLKGQGRFGALLDLIPQEEELVQGDLLVTSALGGIFPDNLLIGELKEVTKSDLAAFQGGEVELFFHPRKENSLFIVTNKP